MDEIIFEQDMPIPYRHLLRLVEFGKQPTGDIEWEK